MPYSRRRYRSSGAPSISGHIDQLVSAIKTHSESSFDTMGGAEQEIIDNADALRSMDRKSGGMVFDIIGQTNDWMAKQEMMRFLCTLPEPDWEQGLDLIQWCTTSKIGLNVGVLNRIMNKAKREGMPIEWIAAAELDEKDIPSNDGGPGTTTVPGLTEDEILKRLQG